MSHETGSENKSLIDLYSDPSHQKSIADGLWGNIPSNIKEALELAEKNKSRFGPPSSQLDALKRELKNHLRSLGILTKLVAENIDGLDRGVVESGQQPVCLAGTSLIINKITCISKLSELSGSEAYAPLFYVADYDGIQNELLNLHAPSPSPRGLLLSLPVEGAYFGCPIYTLANPSEEWLRRSLEKIMNNYKGLLKDSDEGVRASKLQNLEHAFTIIRSAYYSTENVSDWSTKILGTMVNIEADLGVPFLPFSTDSIRPLFQSGFEMLLSEPNRSMFVESANEAVEMVQSAGYTPQIGFRPRDYMPFFLECMKERCRRRRIELKYLLEHGSTTSHIKGKCPSCGEEYDFSFSTHKPDLSEIVDWISPRADSRQIIVDSVLPVLCHVGGPGETGYYAEVIPAARKLALPFPVFFRYTRIFYNTPWNSKYASDLKKDCPNLMNEELFSSLGRWVESRNRGDSSELAEAHRGIRGSIESTFDELKKKKETLENEIEEIKKNLRGDQDKSTLLTQLRERQNMVNSISLYLSSQFGWFSPEKFGQEVSWSWLDLEATTGIKEMLGMYLRYYSESTPNSSMFYVNL